jgi:microcystin-dependent protein
MSEPFIGQIAIFAFGFAPRGWALCAGQLLPLAQNTALFSILGTSYGGDGKSTFALPNLRGRGAIGTGQGFGLSSYDVGDAGGAASVILSPAELAGHSHPFTASATPATVQSPNGAQLAEPSAPGQPGTRIAPFYSPTPSKATTALAQNSIAPAGGNQPHNNMQPYLALNFCIALQGVFPTRG